MNACVSLLKQIQGLSIIAHSDQSQSTVFEKLVCLLCFYIAVWPGSEHFTTTVIATNQEGKVNGMGLTPILTNLGPIPASERFTGNNCTCR